MQRLIERHISVNRFCLFFFVCSALANNTGSILDVRHDCPHSKDCGVSSFSSPSSESVVFSCRAPSLFRQISLFLWIIPDLLFSSSNFFCNGQRRFTWSLAAAVSSSCGDKNDDYFLFGAWLTWINCWIFTWKNSPFLFKASSLSLAAIAPISSGLLIERRLTL